MAGMRGTLAFNAGHVKTCNAPHRATRAGTAASAPRLQRPLQGRVVPTSAEARAYLESLPELWAKTSDAGRHAIAEAVFERIDVLGVTDYTFTLTAHAKARGWDAAFGAGVVRVKDSQSGRGERI